MAKIELDKYYTPIDIARYCIDKTHEVIGIDNIIEYIEPSAGNGSFSLLLPNCIAYDIEPEHDSIIKQDFLELSHDYKKGRCVIGNPPFGYASNLAIQFFKHSIKFGDYIAFILPLCFYNNTFSLYEFDLISSTILPETEYSGVKLSCCFNIYKRPENGLHKRNKLHIFKDFYIQSLTKKNIKKSTVFGEHNELEYEFRKLKYEPDYSMIAWGGNTGKRIYETDKYASSIHISFFDGAVKDKIVELLDNTDWDNIIPSFRAKSLSTWKLYEYIYQNIPDLKLK